MAKSRRTKAEERLLEALRARGLRKNVAETLARATGRARRGARPPKRVQRLLADLKDVTGEVEKRLTGGAVGDDKAKRKAAAKKGAETRKRNARTPTATATGRSRTQKSSKTATKRKSAPKS